LYISHKSAFLQDRRKVQSQEEKIVLTNIIDMAEESAGCNTLRVTIYDGLRRQTFLIDEGYIFDVGTPQQTSKSAWERLKKDGFK